MKVARSLLIVLPNLGGGGAERVKISTARALRALGHRVDLVLLKATGPYLHEVEGDLPIKSLDVERIRDAVLPLRRLIQEEQPDAVLADIWPLTTVVALSCALARTRAKVLLTEQNTLSAQYQHRSLALRSLIVASIRLNARFGQVVAVSEGVAQDLARMTGLPLDKIKVVYNAAPRLDAPEGPSDLDVEAFWGVPRGARILNVGSLKEQKNQEMLIRAFSAMPPSPKARLVILGEGVLRSKLTDLAEALGVASQVHMPGFVDNPRPIYASADLFALSSDFEGLSLALLEAMSAGLRVVATDCPSGTAEVLEDGRWGQLVPVGDTAAFAKAMAEALHAPHDPKSVVARAEAFRPERTAQRIIDIVEGRG